MRYIAVTQRIDGIAQYGENRQGLDIRWSQFFKHNKILPILLPYEYDFLSFFEDMAIAGILITGGNDLVAFSDAAENRIRQTYESELLDFAIGEGIPVWGVCHGMQMIGAYFGEKLVELNGHVAAQHKILPKQEATWYNTIACIGSENSYHQYGFESLSDAFRVVATAQDGSIEAFEHREHKIFGQMWHPERKGSSGILYGFDMRGIRK